MAGVSRHLNSMSSMKLTALSLLALVTAGSIIFLVTWSQRPEYGVLFAGLDPGDAGAVIAKLGDRNIPYRLNGGVISVPEDRVYETRMELAGDGLPGGGGVGFELFDKNTFGLTDFVQRINFRRAMQGELARSIKEIKGVRSARVHLVIPEKGVFLDEEKKARASIVLKLREGAGLGPTEVKAIVHLVAGSLQNLSPSDVTIVDTEGRLWTTDTAGTESAETMLASDMDYRKKVEAGLAARVQTMLEKALGRGKAVARLTVALERRRVQRTEETYDPDSQVVRSEQRTKESSGAQGAEAGVPGAMSNLPGGAGKAGAGAPTLSKKENEVINYEINKVVKSVVEPFGQIRKLSVAVLVDGTYVPAASNAGAGEKGKKKYIPRTEEEMAKITSMVKAAVGFDEKRGDTISVVNIPFKEDLPAPDDAAAEPATPMMTRIMPLAVRYGTVGLSVVFLVFFVLRPIVKRLNMEKVALESIEKTLPAALERGGRGGLTEGEGGARGALEAGGEHHDETEKIKRLVRENPRQAAMVLKAWIQER